LNGCGALCEGKFPCPLICLPPACACREGFYRDASNNCVSASQCPRQCSANETFNSCGNLCEGKCENVDITPTVDTHDRLLPVTSGRFSGLFPTVRPP
uniref:TIL domain-containing protein n=1 Tax=Haemonchus placei TaxID=6290 RepID=A0A0N4WA94_HAEPC